MINAALTAAPFSAAEIFATVFILLGVALACLVIAAQVNATRAKRRQAAKLQALKPLNLAGTTAKEWRK